MKFPKIFVIWLAPVFLLLLVDYKNLLPPISIEILHAIPSFDAYVNGTKYKVLANLVWTYFWITSPFVIPVFIYTHYDKDLGNIKNIKGWFTLPLLIMSIFTCVFMQLDPYIPADKGYGPKLSIYRTTEFGIALIASAVWIWICSMLVMFLQWLSWCKNKLLNS